MARHYRVTATNIRGVQAYAVVESINKATSLASTHLLLQRVVTISPSKDDPTHKSMAHALAAMEMTLAGMPVSTPKPAQAPLPLAV